VAERPAGGGRNRGGVGRWKKEQRGKEALTRGPGLAARGKGGAGAWAGERESGPAAERERKGGERKKELGLGCAELRELGREWPTRGKEEKREARGGELGCWALFSFLLLFFFLSALKPFKPFHLNSNKFEFKPNTNKTMHQHECTSNLIL
jgi:hypothetical protein